MKHRMLFAALAFSACSPPVVDLPRPDGHLDARPVDGAHASDAPSGCVCRIANCRSNNDCGAGGSTCGVDGYCSGSIGACTLATGGSCSAVGETTVCTASSTSTVECGQ